MVLFKWKMVDLVCSVTSCLTLPHAVPVVLGSTSGCSEVIDQNDVYLRCMQSFNRLFESIASLQAGPEKENATASVICSDEGRAGVGCVLEYFGKCPQLMSGEDNSGIYATIEKIQFMGDVNIYCDVWEENCFNQYMECTTPLNPEKGGGDIFSKVHKIGGGSEPPTDLASNYLNVPTFYSNVPKQMTILCGPMNTILTCTSKKLIQLDCPTTIKHIEDKLSYNIEHQKVVDGKLTSMRWWGDFPAFHEAKKYVQEECPNLPDDFNAETLPCIESSVNKPEFVNCWTANRTENEEPSCQLYNRGKNCVIQHVEPRCGKEDATILIGASHLFSRLIPESCAHVSGAGSLSVSLVTTVTLIAVSLISFFA